MNRCRIFVLVLLGMTLVGCVSPVPTGKIAFSSTRDGNPEIYLINADGTGLERLTYGPSYDSNPVFSPDGQHIAFVRRAIATLEPNIPGVRVHELVAVPGPPLTWEVDREATDPTSGPG